MRCWKSYGDIMDILKNSYIYTYNVYVYHVYIVWVCTYVIICICIYIYVDNTYNSCQGLNQYWLLPPKYKGGKTNQEVK